METTQGRAVSNPTVVLGSRFGAKGKATFVAYRQIWLEGWDFETLRRVADCLLFFLEVTDGTAYPVIIFERPEGFDIRWSGEPPQELAGKRISLAGTSFALREAEGWLRVE